MSEYANELTHRHPPPHTHTQAHTYLSLVCNQLSQFIFSFVSPFEKLSQSTSSLGKHLNVLTSVRVERENKKELQNIVLMAEKLMI